jgi:Peptidase M15
MGKKWRYARGLQMPLLLVILCFTQHLLARPVLSASSKNGKASTVAKMPSNSPQETTSARAITKPTKKSAAKARRKNVAKSSSSRTVVHTSSKSATITSAKKNKGNIIAKAQQKSSRKKAQPDVLLEPAERDLQEYDQAAVLEAPFSFSPETAPFPAQLNDERLAYRINSAFVLPAEKFILEVGEEGGENDYLLQSALDVTQIGPSTWLWQAPRKVGLYPVTILHPTWGATMVLNVFVMVPFFQLDGGYLNGYRVGNYPRVPFKQLPTYHPPRGFIEVTRANENVLVSPHFRLRQFLCKQESEYPKYLVLDSRLLLVLETILKKANETGYHCPTLEVMSGYRTPYYNRAIGNSTTYSRHIWGDAADIFVDANPRDGEMDDLNRDGVVDLQDTAALYNIVNKMYEPRIQRFLTSGFMNESRVQQLLTDGFMDESRLQQFLTGGLARYRETRAHGPFVHVDVRGIYTRWGR